MFVHSAFRRLASRTRPLERHRQIQPAARFHECECIRQPTAFVEIDGQEEARLVQEHRIDAGDKRLAGIVAAGQVPPKAFIRDRQEPTIRTIRALDARLFANARTHSFEQAGA
jgi:hypothetical protein